MATATVEPVEQALETKIQTDCTALVVALDQSIMKIEDDASYQAVCTRLRDASANIKAIESYMEPIKKARHAAWKRVTELESRLTAPYQEIKVRDSRMVGNYQLEQQRRAEEEQRRQQEEAEAAAAKERAAQAEQLASEGKVADGVALLENTEVIPEPVIVAPATPKVQGVSAARVRYTAEVINMKELVKAVAEGKVSMKLLTVDQSALNKLASLEQDAFSVPGCKVHKHAGVSVR